ncbi:MAG: AMP-binding protein, partial [Candidatus Omnitrophota bacterium]
MPSSAKKDPEEHLTLIRLFLDRSQEYVEKTALVTRGADGRLEEICWAEWARRVRLAALGLYAAGVRKGDRVAIFAPNSPEWAVADFGILSLGAVGVPVYPGSSVEDVRNILEDSQAGVVFVSTWAQAAGLRAHGFHDVRKIIYFGSEDAGADPAVATSLDELLEAGRLEDLNGT